MKRKNLSTSGLIEHVGGLEQLVALLREIQIPFEGMSVPEETMPIIVNEIRKKYGYNDDLRWHNEERRVIGDVRARPTPSPPVFMFGDRYSLDKIIPSKEIKKEVIKEAPPHALELEEISELQNIMEEMGVRYSPQRAQEIIAVVTTMNNEHSFSMLAPTAIDAFIRKSVGYCEQNIGRMDIKEVLPFIVAYQQIIAHTKIPPARESRESLLDFTHSVYKGMLRRKELSERAFDEHLSATHMLIGLAQEAHKKGDHNINNGFSAIVFRLAHHYMEQLLRLFESSICAEETKLSSIANVEKMFHGSLEDQLEGIEIDDHIRTHVLECRAKLLTYRYEVQGNRADLEKALTLCDDAFIYINVQNTEGIKKNRKLGVDIARKNKDHDPTSLEATVHFVDTASFFNSAKEGTKLKDEEYLKLLQEQGDTILRYFVAHEKVEKEISFDERRLFDVAVGVEGEILKRSVTAYDRSNILEQSLGRIMDYKKRGFTIPQQEQIASAYSLEEEKKTPLKGDTIEFRHYAMARMLQTMMSRECIGEKNHINERDLMQQFQRGQRLLAKNLLDILVSHHVVTKIFPEGKYALSESSLEQAQKYLAKEKNLPPNILIETNKEGYRIKVNKSGRNV